MPLQCEGKQVVVAAESSAVLHTGASVGFDRTGFDWDLALCSKFLFMLLFVDLKRTWCPDACWVSVLETDVGGLTGLVVSGLREGGVQGSLWVEMDLQCLVVINTSLQDLHNGCTGEHWLVDGWIQCEHLS